MDILLLTHKRSKSLARPGQIAPPHPLAVIWANIKMFLDARHPNDPWTFDLDLLGYFGERLEHYSKEHMVSGDESIGQMLLEWSSYASKIADLGIWLESNPCPKDVQPKTKNGIKYAIRGGKAMFSSQAMGIHSVGGVSPKEVSEWIDHLYPNWIFDKEKT